MTITFDGPTGEACLARRDKSNTPLQALTLLNDEVFMDCAQALGRWAAAQKNDPSRIVSALFRRCLTRPPSDIEERKLTAYFEKERKRIASGGIKGAELANLSEGNADDAAAWTALARVLLNLDEAITKE